MFLRPYPVSGSYAEHSHSFHLILIKSHLIGGVLRLTVSDLPTGIKYVLLLTLKFIANEHQMHLRYNSVFPACVCVFDACYLIHYW